MRLIFIINPKSGRGRAGRVADEFAAAVTRAGHHIDQLTIGSPPASPETESWRDRVACNDVAVVFGGDGTVRHLLPALAGSKTALYHVPMGTENLFARQFGMTSRPEDFAAALAAGDMQAIDLGEANGRWFAIMCSVGPDASVVRRLAAGRTGAIRHSSYVRPIFHEVLRPSLGPVSVVVDGSPLVTDARGMLLVANSAMYALGLNPARDASMSDGLLDVLFLPASGTIGLVAWYCRAAIGCATAAHGAAFRRGSSVIVRPSRGVRSDYQLDGDEGGEIAGESAQLHIGVRAGAARVLRRAGAGAEKKTAPVG